jgi:hydrophobe/amphiphile efflux-1 (HAE1) family protein
MISSVFVDRPRLAIVIAIVMTLAGLIALTRIPVAQFPDIVPPQVQVSTSYPGASAAVVEATVAQVIEAQVNGVDQMIYMKSTSANDGSYNLTVSFALGTNADIDVVNVNNRVQAALARLPVEVQQQGLTVRKRSAAILQFLLFHGEGNKLPLPIISNYVTINVLDALARVPGVGQAYMFGNRDYSMRIWFDTDRLNSLGLVPSDVIAAIQSQNVQAAVGRVGAEPTNDSTQFQLNLQTKGRLTTPEEFGNIIVRANPDGSVLRVREVARVELGAAAQDIESRLNGDPAIAVAVYLSPGANAVATSARVLETLDSLAKRFPAGLTGSVVYDSSTFVTDTIHEVEWTLAQAFGLVVLVVFVFMGNLRATIIPAVAVPVSLIATFAMLLAFGYSANTVSLLALVLAIGVVVDDAIVVVENVERVMGEEPDLSAAAVGVRADRVHPRTVGIAVPPVCRHHQRRHAVLGDQRADPLAGAVRGVPAPWRTTARHHGLGAAPHRQRSRRLRRGRAPAGAGGDSRCGDNRRCRIRRLPVVPAHALRLSAAGGPGRLLRLCPIARWRFAAAHARDGDADRSAAEDHAAGRERDRHRRLFGARQRRGEQRGVHGGEAETLRRPHGSGRQRPGADRTHVHGRTADPHGDDLSR